MNLIMPVMHANTALATLLLPAMVRASNWKSFRRILLLGIACLSTAAVLYWILIGALSGPIVGWLYAGQYTEYAHLLWFVGAIPLLASAGNVLASALRAMERPNLVFQGYALAAVAAGTLGLGAVIYAGIEGAVLGLLFSYAVMGVILLRKLAALDKELNTRTSKPAA